MFKNSYDYLFYKLYHWVNNFFPSYYKIDEAIACGIIAFIESILLLTIYNCFYYKLKFPEHISSTPLIGVFVIGTLYLINLWYFTKNKRYEIIIAKYYSEVGMKKISVE